MLNRSLPAPYRDVLLLVARVLIAVIMFAHGYHNMVVKGLGRTTEGFEAMSIPLAIVSASFVTVVEIAGSALLVLGALTPLVSVCNLVIMIGAAVFVHIKNGIFVADNGWELVGALTAGFLLLIAVGPGRYSIDHLVLHRQEAHREAMHRAHGSVWPRVRRRDAAVPEPDAGTPPGPSPVASPGALPAAAPPARPPAGPAAADLWTPTEDLVPPRTAPAPVEEPVEDAAPAPSVDLWTPPEEVAPPRAEPSADETLDDTRTRPIPVPAIPRARAALDPAGADLWTPTEDVGAERPEPGDADESADDTSTRPVPITALPRRAPRPRGASGDLSPR